MKAPDKIYVTPVRTWDTKHVPDLQDNIYINKDALLGWAEKELERLYELIPDAHKVEDETATPMEMRYLGQYMQMESVIDNLNSM